MKKETKIEHYIKRAYKLLEKAKVSYDYDELFDMAKIIEVEEEEDEVYE